MNFILLHFILYCSMGYQPPLCGWLWQVIYTHSLSRMPLTYYNLLQLNHNHKQRHFFQIYLNFPVNRFFFSNIIAFTISPKHMNAYDISMSLHTYMLTNIHTYLHVCVAQLWKIHSLLHSLKFNNFLDIFT